MGRPTSSNARCIKGCKKILDVKPRGMFTCEDVAVWCDVTRKYAYQVVTYGITQGYIDVAKKDQTNSTTYYQLRGASKKWLTRRWGNGSLDSHKQESSRADVQVCDGEHREEDHVRDSASAAIEASKRCLALLSQTPSERAKQRRIWNSTPLET